MIDNKTYNFAVGALRRLWHRSPIRIEFIKSREIREFLPLNADGTPPKRARVYLACEQCGTRCKSTANAECPKYEIDHVDPVKPLDGRHCTLDEIAERIFTTPSNLMVLCDPCHRQKSLQENAIRREAKKNAQSAGSVGREQQQAPKRAS